MKVHHRALIELRRGWMGRGDVGSKKRKKEDDEIGVCWKGNFNVGGRGSQGEDQGKE